MKNIVSQQTLNQSIYLATILVFWALTLNKCIVLNSKSVNLRICSENNAEVPILAKEKNTSACNLIDEAEIKIKDNNKDSRDGRNIPPQEILEEHSNKII